MLKRGFTLVEITAVVLVLGIVGLVAANVMGSTEHELALEAAASEVAAALRFARSETLRTGEPHGVNADIFSQRVRVYYLDESVSPAVVKYIVRDPVDKRLYDLNFDTNRMLEPVSMTSAVFWYSDMLWPVGLVGFNPDGTPKYNNAGSVEMLNSGKITLAAGGHTRVVEVAPMTGRVTIQ